MQKSDNDDFRKYFGITEEEEKFFEYLYRRERRFRTAIAVLIFAIVILLLLK